MTDEKDEAVGPLFLKPSIESPPLSSTVSPGFNIRGLGVVFVGGLINKWNLDFFWKVNGKDNHRRFSWNLPIPLPLSDFTFTVPADLIPPGAFWFQIEFRYGLFYSEWAQSGNMVMRAPVSITPPTITAPAGVVWTPRPYVTGRGEPNSEIKLYRAGSGTVEYGKATVFPDGGWITTLHTDLPTADPFQLQAMQTSGGQDLPSNVVNLTVLYKPVIGSITVADRKPTVNGSEGLRGARVEIFQHGDSSTPLMSGTVRDDGNWTATSSIRWAAATYTLTAKQIGPASGYDSDWAEPKTVVIEPPKPPPPQFIHPSPGTTHPANVTITGTCLAGAQVYVQDSAGTLLKQAAVVGTGWELSYSWTPGKKDVKAVQTVEGVTSDASGVLTFNVQPRQPAITPPTNPAGLRQALVVTNIESGAVTFRMFQSGVEVPGSFTGTGSTRTFTPSNNWLRGSNTVRVAQTVNGVSSESAPCTFTTVVTIEPPYIRGPRAPTSNPVEVYGSGRDGSTVQVVRHGHETPVLGTGYVQVNVWTAKIGITLPPGRTLLSAKQIFSDSHSGWVDPFELKVKPPKPEIIPPPNPSGLRQPLTITNVYPSSQLRVVRGGAVVAGSFDGTGSSLTFTPDEDWSMGSDTVWAQQRVDTVDSDQSAKVTFNVAAPPAPPLIIYPVVPTNPRPTFKGTGIERATVNVVQHLHPTPILASATVLNGEWTATLNEDHPDLPAGPFYITATQSLDGAESMEVEPPFLINVKPQRPLMDQPPSPADQSQTLSIKFVHSDADVLRVQHDLSGEVTGWFTSTGDTHTFTPDPEWEPGNRKVFVIQSVKGVWSDPSIWYLFDVKPPTPAITPPPTAVEPNQALTITGVYSNAATLALFDEADLPVAGGFSGTGATRVFTPTLDWATGSNTVRAKQTVNTVESDFSAECTFTVEEQGDKPEAPRFELPSAGMATSTRPVIKVNGLPGALITVRLREAEVLCSKAADTNGVLAFRVASALTPGPIDLEVKQKAGGPESSWSEEHKFFVNAPPKTPTIEGPIGFSARTPTILGKGETRGCITIRHETDSEDQEIATFDGRRSWRWTATERWDLGKYSIVARQTDDGDSSPPSEPHEFEVVDSRYGIGDAGPVLGQPVAGKQSVLLRAQVLSGVTGDVAARVKVEWRIKDEPDVLATTETGLDGWAEYRYTPSKDGIHEVLADITSDNQGVVMTQPFKITALLADAWAQEAELYLDGKRVDLAEGDLVLSSGKPYELELKANSGSRLIGSVVALTDLWEPAERGLKFDPVLGTPRLVEDGKSVLWKISFDGAQAGPFGLNLISLVLPDWHLPGRVEVLAEEVDVKFDTFPSAFGGEKVYPCLGASHAVFVKPGANSLLPGKQVTLELSEEAAALGVTVTPNTPQEMVAQGLGWTVDCSNSVKAGEFAVTLKAPELGFRSQELRMSLGHNIVQIAEKHGPVEVGAPVFDDWMTRIRTRSSFTQLAAGGVSVAVEIDGVTERRLTDSDGWLRVIYRKGKSASFRIHNPYDGSDIGGSL